MKHTLNNFIVLQHFCCIFMSFIKYLNILEVIRHKYMSILRTLFGAHQFGWLIDRNRAIDVAPTELNDGDLEY